MLGEFFAFLKIIRRQTEQVRAGTLQKADSQTAFYLGLNYFWT